MKAILVIDMPNDCTECPCFVWDEEYCLATWNEMFQCWGFGGGGKGEPIPSHCPLKPLPHSKQMENRWFSDDYSKGWNDCLKEINETKKTT